MQRSLAPLLSILGLLTAEAIIAAVPTRIALVPLERRVRDAEAAVAVETALRFQLTELGELVSSLETRDQLRRMRLRDVDSGSPQLIHDLANELGADWVVVATIHDVRRLQVSDLALSIRFYDGDSGELVWADFQGRNGLDGRKALGLGVLTSIDDLARELVRRILKDSILSADQVGNYRALEAVDSSFGRVALVPFTGYVEKDALGVADAVTEASRAVLIRRGMDLVAPGCVAQALRLQRAQVWGELAAATRSYLRDTCQARLLLTGSVGQWEVSGSAFEPVPKIALAVRLLDAANGKILWMSSIEKTGRSTESLFRIGRIYSRGTLLDRLLTRLTDEMLEQGLSRSG